MKSLTILILVSVFFVSCVDKKVKMVLDRTQNESQTQGGEQDLELSESTVQGITVGESGFMSLEGGELQEAYYIQNIDRIEEYNRDVEVETITSNIVCETKDRDVLKLVFSPNKNLFQIFHYSPNLEESPVNAVVYEAPGFNQEVLKVNKFEYRVLNSKQFESRSYDYLFSIDEDEAQHKIEFKLNLTALNDSDSEMKGALELVKTSLHKYDEDRTKTYLTTDSETIEEFTSCLIEK